MSATIEEKKKFLKQYRYLLFSEKGIEDEIRELRASAMFPAQVNDGMPHGTGLSDLSSYAAILDKMMKKLWDEKQKKWEARREIMKAIEELPNETEKCILIDRYINGKKWEEIAVDMSYSYQHVIRLHGNALIHLKI